MRVKESDGSNRAMRMTRVLLLCCFIVSGFAGLLYEIVWVRIFSLVFGNTVYSTAAVLAAFMGGLGAGGWWFGRFIEKRKTAVLFYGLVELVVGLYAFVPLLLKGILEGAYPALFSALQGSLPALVAVKAFAALAILIVPTFCMGATLPLLAKFLASRSAHFGRSISALYGLNTLGAVCGVLLTGFVLMRFLGMRGTLFVGLCLNLGIGLTAIALHLKIQAIDRKAPADAPEVKADVKAKPAESLGTPATRSVAARALVATFVAGFVSMLFEVAWTRSITLILGSSVYAFSLVLLTFLLGMSLGSLGTGAYFRKRPHAAEGSGPASLGICLLAVAVTSTAALPAIKVVIFAFVNIIAGIQGDYGLVLLLQFGVCVAFVFIPALFFGAAFPIAMTMYARATGIRSAGLGSAAAEVSGSLPSSVGKVYFWNTIGAILGSTLTGFILIPLAGVSWTLLIGILSALAIGIALSISRPGANPAKRLAPAALALAFTALVGATWRWDPYLMSSGPFIYFGNLIDSRSPSAISNDIKNTARIPYNRDGVSSTVTVLQTQLATYLRVNGKTDASTGGDVHTQLMLAALPMTLHPEPKRVAVIGMGSGMTAGAALQVPSVERLDLVEIEPYVVEASTYFEDYNFKPLSDKRTRLHIEDGRNYMLTHDDKYDVIISEPSNHWIAGISELYSRDYYELAAKRMEPGAIYCQWVQFYSMTPESLGMILGTFRSVFSETQVFILGGDLFLIGSRSQIPIHAEGVANRLLSSGLYKKIVSAPFGTKFDPLGLVAAHYVAGPEEVRKLSLASRLNTDDRPDLEYEAPFELFAQSDGIVAMLRDTFPIEPLGRVGLDPAKMTAAQYFGIAYDGLNTKVDSPRFEEYLLRAVELDPQSPSAAELLAQYYERKSMPLLANKYYAMGMERGAGKATGMKYVAFLTKQKDYAAAAAALRPIQSASPRDRDVLEATAVIDAGLGHDAEAAREFIAVIPLLSDPRAKAFSYFSAEKSLAKTSKSNVVDQIEYLANANQLWPEHEGIAGELARMLIVNGDLKNAEYVIDRALQAIPSSVGLGLQLADIRDRRKAAGK